jgi:hypothetical protein
VGVIALSCQVDNTVRENKNRTVLMYLSWLINALNLSAVSLCFLRKGHTHNRLGIQSSEWNPYFVYDANLGAHALWR